MTNLFTELSRRNVFRVGVAYIIAAWVAAQVADLVLEAIGAPPWVMQSLLLLLSLGFVAAVIIAWAYELTPDGIKREKDVVRDDSITHHTAKRLNIITIGLVLAALALFLGDRFFWDHSRPEIAAPVADNTATGSEPPLASTDQGSVDVSAPGAAAENSIAVLPFVNMSSDKEQEYFADGISEEILNALVKADGLQVSGRTSSFSFKGKDANIQEIGRVLNVAHVLEGSVRKQANQVRITAQLIKADDGFHMWSETYDRSLENIFDVQDDISRHVTKELLKLLKLDDQDRLANVMTANMDAYDLFLRGRAYIGKRINDNIPTGMALLRQAVSLDPEFAEAWAALAEAEVASPGYIVVDPAEAHERAREYAETAIRLNPTLALPYAALGLIEKAAGSPLEAREALMQAYEMEPNNVLVLRWLGTILQALGYFDKSLALFERASELDPMSRTDAWNNAAVRFSLGDLDEAERLFEKTGRLQNEIVGFAVGDIRFVRGDVAGAVEHALRFYDEQVAKYGVDDIFSRSEAEVYARGLYSGVESDRRAAVQLDQRLSTESSDYWYWRVYEHIKLGNIERAFEILEKRPELFSGFASDFMWYPVPRSIEFRQHPDFPALLERHNFREAWQALGWPDLCQPNPGTDGSDGQFSCN